MSDSAHVTAVKNQAKLREKSAQRRRIVGGRLEQYTVDVSAQEGAAAIAAAIEAEPYKPGQLVEGKGIFIGIWTPKDREGNTLSQTFNAFAAPEDLIQKPGIAEDTYDIPEDTYDIFIKRIAELKLWHGHNGANYYSDRELIEDLKNGTYTGGWFMPPIELMCGYNIDDNPVQPDHLDRYKDTGALKDAFHLTRNGGVVYMSYWSSSMPDNSLATRCFRFADGRRLWQDKSVGLRCRPMRLELKP